MSAINLTSDRGMTGVVPVDLLPALTFRSERYLQALSSAAAEIVVAYWILEDELGEGELA